MQFGPYTLLRKLAIGGMAEVYLARETRQSGLERYVVIKRIHPHLAENSEFLRAFLQEGKLGAQLQHPNIAQVFDMGQQDGIYFLSLEYVRGVDLVQIFRRAQRKRHRMTRELILRIAIDVLRALDYAHEAKDIEGRPLRIIHRDVSPGNVLLGWDGTAKLVDFGIAKAASFDQHTRPGTIKGKLAYMAPEQILGDGPIDRRIDLFALGVILHELATGRRLFKADTEGRTMANVLGGNIPPLAELRPDLPAQLCNLVHHTLQRSPDQRFQSAADMLTEAERVANETGGLQPVRAELSLLLRDEGEPAEPEDPALAGLFVAPKAITSSWSVSAFDLPALGRGIFPPPKGASAGAPPSRSALLPAAPPGPAGSSPPNPPVPGGAFAPPPAARPGPAIGPGFSEGFDADGMGGLGSIGGFQPEDFRLPDAREASSPGLSQPPAALAGSGPDSGGGMMDMLGSLDDELPAPAPAQGYGPSHTQNWETGLPPPQPRSAADPHGFEDPGSFSEPSSIQVIDPRQQPPGGTGGPETSFADLLGDSSDRLPSPLGRVDALAPLPAGIGLAAPVQVPGPPPHPSRQPVTPAAGVRTTGSSHLPAPAPPSPLQRRQEAPLPPLPAPAVAPEPPVAASDLGGVSLESREALLAAYAASTLEARLSGAGPGRGPGAPSPTPFANDLAGGLGGLSGPPLGAGLGIGRPESQWKAATLVHGTPEVPPGSKETPLSLVRLPERPQFVDSAQPDTFIAKHDEEAEKKKRAKPTGRGRTIVLALLGLIIVGVGGVFVAERVGFGNARVGLNALLERVIPARSTSPDGGPTAGPEVASAGASDGGPAAEVAPTAGADAGAAGAVADPPTPAGKPGKGKPGTRAASGPVGPARNGTLRLEVSATTEVDVDGQAAADAGLKVRSLSLAPGKHAVRVREPAISAERTFNVDIQAGRQQYRRIQFSRGTLKVVAATGSSVRIDGRYIGRAPLDQLLLYEGPHSLEVEDPSSGVKTRRDVRIQPGRLVNLNLGTARRAAPVPATP